MHNQILSDLAQIEKEHQVTILYACESGSRAWGFASPDSDYDVRFIYIHPPDWYLSISDKADHISPPPDEVLDYKGWELRKTLQLLSKSNASVFEYAQSPIVYIHRPPFMEKLQELLPQYFSARACMHHYLGLAINAYESLRGQQEIRMKKYFYVLRSLLSAMWIAKYNAYAPMEFHILRRLLAVDENGIENERYAALNKIIDDLLAIKIRVTEADTIARTPLLDNFIEHELARCKQAADEFPRRQTDVEPLNVLFRSLVMGSGKLV